MAAAGGSYELFLGFVSGGAASCVATAATNPIDVMKVDLQLSKKGIGEAVRDRVTAHGFASYMDGSMPALVRAITYSAFRLAAYRPIKQELSKVEGTLGSPAVKVLSGLTSGAAAAFLANPVEMIKVRSQSGYYRAHAFAFGDVLTHGFSGVGPHVLRGAVHTASQIATYDIVKSSLKREAGLQDGLALHASVASVAGLATTAMSSPFDAIKTHTMANQTSVARSVATILAAHGPKGFWRGWSAGYARTGPHTIITFITMEHHRARPRQHQRRRAPPPDDANAPALSTGESGGRRPGRRRFFKVTDVEECLKSWLNHPLLRYCAMAAPKKKTTSISLAAGCVAGAVECCCTWPMEYIKTQLQSFRTVKGGPAPPFTGIGSGLAYTVRTTGALSLYNGLAPVLAFSAPKAGVRFGANTHFRNALADPDTGKVSMGASFLAGLGAGVCEATLAVTPQETLKTKLINLNMGLADGVPHLLRTEGLGLYAGWFSTCLKQGGNQGSRFFYMAQWRLFMAGDAEAKLPRHVTFAGGLGAGLFSVVCTSPFDVVKTRMQSTGAKAYASTADCFRQIAANEGPWPSSAARAAGRVPGQGIIFLAVDVIYDAIAAAVEPRAR
ncbi:hypothetical protein JL722_13002 [Aureococcus anophagefferens]|nr:hypothetical protein JL722_13002 [Aureococcus anophagefferens]